MKKENKDTPAFPTHGSASDESPCIITPQDYGLTKREYFAALIMANEAPRWGADHAVKAAQDSVKAADALLKELEKKTL